MYKFGMELLGTVTANLKLMKVYGCFIVPVGKVLARSLCRCNLSIKHMQGKSSPFPFTCIILPLVQN